MFEESWNWKDELTDKEYFWLSKAPFKDELGKIILQILETE